MMKQTMAAVLVASAVAACGGSETPDFGPPAENRYPTVKSITATPAEPTPGQTVTLTAVATDPDGDAIAYHWSSDCGGTFADASSATTTWVAPDAAASCNLQLLIREPGVPYHTGFNATKVAVNVTAPQPTAVYESYPSPVPPALVSEGFQATGTSEFGDAVTLAGTARQGVKADFVMVTWSLDAFTHPITLNLYHPDDLAHPFATRTQSFAVPARPAADPSCSDGRWLASDGCHYGYAFPITFDLTGVTLPDTFVFGIAYNTQTYGAQPIGQDGPYNSLNVGLFGTAPTVGTRVDGTAYQNSSSASAYTTGTPGQFGPDTAWDVHVPAKFTALP